MFEDSLFDSGAGRRPRKPWAKLASLAIEACAIGVLVILPLLYTQALPKQMWEGRIDAPLPPQGPPPPQSTQKPMRVVRPSSEAEDRTFREPSYIPKEVAIVHEDSTEASAPPVGNFVVGAIPGAAQNPVIAELTKPALAPLVKSVAPQKLRVSSGVAAGMIVQQVKPQYPTIAVQARIQGTVVLQAVIGKDGRVENLRLISGHPMLAPAAIEAVKQWRYRPYLLNGEPVEVDTTINVNFTLGGG